MGTHARVAAGLFGIAFVVVACSSGGSGGGYATGGTGQGSTATPTSQTGTSTPTPSPSPIPSPSPSPSTQPSPTGSPSAWLYVANSGSDNITTFKLDPTTGVLSNPMDTAVTPNPPVPGGPAFQIAGLATDPTSTLLFACGTTSQATFPPTINRAVMPFTTTGGALTAGSVVTNGSGSSTRVLLEPTATVLFTVDATPNAVTPGGTTANGNLQSFTYNPGTGVPAAGTGVATGASGPPTAAAIDPTGTFLYAVNPTDKTLQAYGVDTGGFIAGTQPPVVTTPSPANVICIDAQGRNIFTGNSDGTVTVFVIQTPGNALLSNTAPVEPSGATVTANVAGIAVDPTGQFVVTANGASNDVSLLQVIALPVAPGSTAPGIAVQVVGTPVSIAASTPSSVVFNGSGTVVYVANSGGNSISGFALSSNALTPLAGSPFALPANDTTPVSLAVSR